MESRKHVCRDCGRGFAVASWLTRHRMKAHSNSFATKKHICGVCGRSFALASWLSRHQKVHENTTTSVEPEEPVSQEAPSPTATEPKKKYLLPWVCGDCGVRFKYVSWLKRHQKNSRHSNGHFDREDQTSLYKWSCDHPGCDKSYKMKHHLARHKLSHLRDPKEAPVKPVNKETNFVCDVCGKEFITRRMFTRHERKHAKGVGTSVKAECGICSKTFDTKDLLERHFKRIHGNEVSAESNSHAVGPPYSCRYCSKKFKEPLAFGRHIAHHKKLERTQEAKAQLQKNRDGESEINKNKNDLITSKHKTSEEDSSKSKSIKESTASKPTKAKRETPERDAKRDKFRNRSSDRKADTLDSSNSDTNPFECDICGRRFAVSFWLTRHKAEHDQAERPHQCDECGRTFAVAAWLTRHKRDHETVASSTASDENSKPDPIIKGNSKVYKCDICGLEFPWPSWMLKHRKLHTIKLTKVKKRGKTKFTSVTQSVPPVTKFEPSNPHEGKSAQEMFELVDKNGTREYQCKVCKKTTIWHTGIIYHVRVHHTHEKPFKCKFCPKAFHMAGDLTKHNRRHTEEELYNCNSCDKTFESSQQAKKHENSHNKSTPFQCKYCGKAYSNRSSVWRHISRSACPESLQATRSKDSATIAVKRAKKTLQSAFSEPPTKQPKLSKSKIVLEKGENLDKQEEPDRPVKLVEDKGFKIKKVRGKGHEKKSSKKKSYVCQNCNKTFTSKEAFAGHIEKYIENNQIVCEFCGKCWVRSADLKRHRRVHTGERPYVCPDCGLGFKVSDALKRHMVKLHPKSTKSPIIVKTTDNSEAEFEQKASDNDVGTDMIDDDAQLDSKAKQEEGNMNKEKIKRKKNKKEQERQDSQMESVEYIQKDLDLEKEDGNSTKENMNHENAQHGNSNPPNDENCGNKKQKKPMKASKKNKKKTNKNKCEYCGKLYSGPGNLTRHVRLHTGEKPFKCKECGQCFMRSDILTQHIGKHHYIK